MLFHQLHKSFRAELDNILAYWTANTVDTVNGGFKGRVDENNVSDAGSPKGAVLNARICWTYAAAWQVTGNQVHRELAQRAFEYIDRYFIDPVNGGVYWTLEPTGNPLDDKKQVYAIAFAIYGISEWYRACNDPRVLDRCIELYASIRRHSLDKEKGGCLEAFSRNWQPLKDQRLSGKDMNAAKTMNTHLHVLEAYANLYAVWPDKTLAEDIRDLLLLFETKFIDKENGHLHLYFDTDWNLQSQTISFGHDIEAGWLLLEAAEILGDAAISERYRQHSIRLVDAALKGMDTDGGLWYEFEPVRQHLVKEKHWWPQAEALPGLFNAWRLTMDDRYLDKLLKTWEFILRELIDRRHGEWHWGITEDGRPMPGQDKAGSWKCPYHNGRACLVMMRELGRIAEC